MVQVHFDQVSKFYADGTKAVDSLNLHVADGNLLCVLGPSGCGKSSIIRMLAGLEEVSQGEIRIDGRRVNELPPQERDAAMVFENYALYPHLNSFENIAMPLRARGRGNKDVEKLVKEVASTLRISELLDRRPAKLSGGQRQRVAIGRAIIRSPRLFLMDEPLGHLEAYLRVELRAEIRALQERLGVTTLYVTHDQEEAAALADCVAIISHGRLQQAGTFLEVLERPANTFVASFIGEPPMNLLKITEVSAEGMALAGGSMRLDPSLMSVLKSTPGTPSTFGIRPQDIDIGPIDLGDFPGQVILVQPQGRSSILVVQSDAVNLTLQTERPVAAGDRIGLTFNRGKVHVFDETGSVMVHGMKRAHG